MAKDFGMTSALTDKFWQRVEKRAADECWPWNGTRNRSGHGKIWNGERNVAAHRYAYALATGDKALDKIICHKCSVPYCVNPAHLYAGTYSQNTWDAIRAGSFNYKGQGRGEAHSMAKLTEAQAVEIKHRLVAGGSVVAIAREYGVTKGAISRIRRGKNWTHVGPTIAPEPLKRLTKEQVREIKAALALHAGYGAGIALARQYGVSGAVITRIKGMP